MLWERRRGREARRLCVTRAITALGENSGFRDVSRFGGFVGLWVAFLLFLS